MSGHDGLDWGGIVSCTVNAAPGHEFRVKQHRIIIRPLAKSFRMLESLFSSVFSNRFECVFFRAVDLHGARRGVAFGFIFYLHG